MPRARHPDLPVRILLTALIAASAGCLTKPVTSRAIRQTDAAVARAPDGGIYPPPPTDGPANPDPPTDAEPNGSKPPPEPMPGTGTACERNDQCESGFCSDGFCCNVACSGSCVSCNQPGRLGECYPVPAGQADPRNSCRKDPEASCGQSGFCNGRGGCAKFAPGTACGAPACTGPRTFIPGGECDGDGLCVKGAPVECAPFNCEGSTCRASCVTDADCGQPNVCLMGRCGLRGIGQTCTASDQCQSNFCVDGVCCQSACTGRCEFCASPAARGQCLPVREGAPDPRAASGITDPAKVCLDEGPEECGRNGRCDGDGGCEQYEDGTVCRPARCEGGGTNQEFGQSICQDGDCESPAGLSCAPFRGCAGARCRRACDEDDDRCVDHFFCTDGDRCTKQVQGGECEENIDCQNGICAQGRCCNQACDGRCRSCDLGGSRGVCTARTFTSEIFMDEEQVLEGRPVFFEDGDPIPAGRYTLTYLEGCMKYAPDQGWTVNATDETGCCSWYLIGADTTQKKLVAPGNVGFVPGMGAHVEYDACVSASRATAPKTFDHPGGPLGIFLQDAGYTDNVTGEEDNPGWRLSGTLTCP
jgi:hypothetical protein